MSKKIYKIPEFKNDTETADFWDTHDSTKYLKQTKPINLKFPKPRHKVVIGLGNKQWKFLQILAQHRQVSFNHLLEEIVSEKLIAIH